MTEMKNRLKGTRESLKKIEDKENSYKSEKIEFDQVENKLSFLSIYLVYFYFQS